MSRPDSWPFTMMPSHSANLSADDAIRRSTIIHREARDRSNVSDRRASRSAIPIPMQAERSGLVVRAVPDDSSDLWSIRNQHSSSDGESHYDADPIHFSNSRSGIHPNLAHLASGLGQSTPMNDNGLGYPETREWVPTQSVAITNNPGPGLYPPLVASNPVPTYPRFSVTPRFEAQAIQQGSSGSFRDGHRLPISYLDSGLAVERSPLTSQFRYTVRGSLNRVDFSELEYVGNVDPNLICPICQSPLVGPVETECGHTFCSECIYSAMQHQGDEKSCPNCRQSFPRVRLEVVNTIVDRMLDDLVVRCVSKSKGCQELMTRSNVLDHVNRHCGYSDIACPDIRCRQILQRRQATDDQCHHRTVMCNHCPTIMAELEVEDHMMTRCERRVVACRDCNFEMHLDEMEEHKRNCPDAFVQCDAAPYGCIFVSKREGVIAHAHVCPLVMLGPHFEALQNRIKTQEDAIERIQRQNDMFKEFMIMTEDNFGRLTSPPLLGVPPHHDLSQLARPLTGESNHQPAGHHFSLHESLREDIARVRDTVSAVNARANTISINESLRHAEEIGHINAKIANLRAQVQWLIMSQRERNAQRALGSQDSVGNGQLLPEPVEDSPNQHEGGVELGSSRRQSDPNREDPNREDPKL